MAVDKDANSLSTVLIPCVGLGTFFECLNFSTLNLGVVTT